MLTATGAVAAVSSTPVGILALLTAVTLIGGFVGALSAIRRGIIRPLDRAADKLHDVTSLPELVRDLTSTLSSYITDNEQRGRQTDARLGRVENLLSLWAFRTLGPPSAFTEDEARQAVRLGDYGRQQEKEGHQ